MAFSWLIESDFFKLIIEKKKKKKQVWSIEIKQRLLQMVIDESPGSFH